jgi:hypothetical protein
MSMSNPFEDLEVEQGVRLPRRTDKAAASFARLTGLLGVAALGIGAFLPAIRRPVAGLWSYWRLSYRDGMPVEGVALLMLAASSCAAVAGKWYRLLWLMGLGALCTVAVTFFRVRSEYLRAIRQGGMQLVQLMMVESFHSISYQPSWPVLLIGILLLFTAATTGIMPSPRRAFGFGVASLLAAIAAFALLARNLILQTLGAHPDLGRFVWISTNWQFLWLVIPTSVLAAWFGGIGLWLVASGDRKIDEIVARLSAFGLLLGCLILVLIAFLLLLRVLHYGSWPI